MESKIIQLMSPPAGVYGKIFDDCGNQKEVPLLAVALTELGETVFLYVINNQKTGRTKEAADHRSC
jgi:hypothetical protein